MSITLEEALNLVVRYAPVLNEEYVPLAESVGRRLTSDIRSAFPQPPFDRSPLDGYAVVAADVASATPDTPVKLQVVDKLWAGMPARVGVKRGQAVRLMTGCMIPSGADAVIRQEDTDLGVEIVQIFRPVASGKNICYRGEEYGTDALLLRRENRVDAASVAVAAGAGFTQLRVRRRARAVILTTGDEVRQPGTVLPAGKIYDSNTAYLSARLHQLGVETVAALTQEDDLTALSAALRRYAGEVDLILTTGGVSVGEKDLLEQAVKAAGAEVIFHGIDIKPGMPTLFAVLGNARLLGLSGNPFSAVVPFELLLRPMLAEMTGDPEPLLRADTAIAAQGFDKASPSRRFLRAFCKQGRVYPPAAQSNGQMRSMIGCNCLIDVPAGSGAIRPGDPVRILWL
ncbi:gephyrin-like molybdotransferase Glp [uncultured Oscillibacter sp.]|uniref:molybdopterin molybdotransferase MoeA n=1 Tax=Dysosmobacter welbionis TaxID=2093857 RepID=UPI00266FF1BD|nr:gephyrin-like molybdotransferase Glp [uncultured Oscillibacter sp.]